MSKITATRYHDFSAGHRVYGHEGACAFLHGHNYRAHFTVEADLDPLGRVMDFKAIKECLCYWLENNWDHKMLLWRNDPAIHAVRTVNGDAATVVLDFNPTAENMAQHLLTVVGPQVLPAYIRLINVTIEETRKCSATAGL